MMTKKSPQLRFEGFTDDWEQRKLKEITSLITKGTTPKDKSGKGEVNFIKVENIDPFSGQINDSSKISFEEHEGYLKRSQLKENDILFSIAGTLGRTSVINKNLLPANTNQALAILRISEGKIPYIVTILKGRAVEDYIRKNPTVGAQPNLSLEQVGNLSIPFPSIPEQQQIGTFFAHLDTLISLHQRKLDLLKEQKKGFLQKMFPKNGEKVPELRFAGFADDWEERKLGELALVLTGFPFKNEDFVDNGKYLVITNGNIQNESSTVDVSLGNRVDDLSDEIKERYYLNKNDILVTMDGTVGRTAKVVDDNLILAQRVARLVANKNTEFVYQWLNQGSFFNEMTKVSHGGTIKHISLNEISNYSATVPSNNIEQQKIGSFFKQLDDTIALHQRKLDLLKEQKKGFLQKMFV
ncbi:restriction endonuclease subunit S [Streptococcus alactolyticus]|uniref:restriction endonuclease subunit S n=1 Tax=Streptococcus alactolyticus TaxID=29389 RepID=UPI0037539CB3